MPHVTQEELYQVPFALTEALAPLTKTFLLPLQAPDECKRKHDTQQDPGTHSSFLGRDEKGPFFPVGNEASSACRSHGRCQEQGSLFSRKALLLRGYGSSRILPAPQSGAPAAAAGLIGASSRERKPRTAFKCTRWREE